jgi:hypothetical protein
MTKMNGYKEVIGKAKNQGDNSNLQLLVKLENNSTTTTF